MDNRFSRNIPALSEDECALLRTKHIAVIGCGGLGGHIIEMMARIGAGHITCVDGDVFEPTNLNRQLLSEEALIGTAKADAAAKRIAAVNSRISCRTVKGFMTRENAQHLIEGCDLVFDALDNIEGRLILEEACEKRRIPYVHGAIAGWAAQAALCMPGEGLARKLYPEGVAVGDKSVLSFTPALCAAVQVSLGVRYLTGRKVDSGTLHCYDLLHQEYESIPFV